MRNVCTGAAMLANSDKDRVQKHKIGIAPIGETNPEIFALNGETSMNHDCPKNFRIVHVQVKHKNSGVKTSRGRRPLISNPSTASHASGIQELALQQ